MIKNNIDNMIKEAMMSHDKIALRSYRAIKAKFIEYETSKEHKSLDDATEFSILNKMIKEREESSKIYRDNNRIELMQSELDEVKVLKSLLPAQISLDELKERIDELYPDGIEKKEMGQVIKLLRNSFAGIADGKSIADVVKSKLI